MCRSRGLGFGWQHFHVRWIHKSVSQTRFNLEHAHTYRIETHSDTYRIATHADTNRIETHADTYRVETHSDTYRIETHADTNHLETHSDASTCRKRLDASHTHEIDKAHIQIPVARSDANTFR